MMDTFRNEALKHHNDTEYGDIILPTSFGISVCAAATLFIIFSLFLVKNGLSILHSIACSFKIYHFTSIEQSV